MVHELSHLVHMNHGQEYWQLVAQYSPDYNLHRKWLNENKGSIFAEVELAYHAPEEENAAEEEHTAAETPADSAAPQTPDSPALRAQDSTAPKVQPDGQKN